MMTNYKIEIKWAFIFIGTLLLWSTLERLLGFHGTNIDKHQYFSMFFLIPAILVYVLALKAKKTKYFNGQMSYKQGLISGIVISIIVTIFTPLTQWIVSEVISPYYFDNVIAFSVDEGHYTLEEAKAYFNYKSYAIQSTVFSFFMGVVTTIIVAFFVKTKKTLPSSN